MKSEVDLEKITSYKLLQARLLELDPTSPEFSDVQAEAESLWETLSLEEKAILHTGSETSEGSGT